VRAISADPPARPEPRRLGDDQGLPGEFLVGFTDRLLDRRQQLLDDGHPPQAAREQAVTGAVQAFTAAAEERGWTVTEGRIAQLAGDTLGLEEEFRDQYGHPPELARLFAVGEVLAGERAREETPLPWRRWEDDPPQRPGPVRGQWQPSERPRPDSRPATVRTREAGHER
jgi:hypothetical protein